MAEDPKQPPKPASNFGTRAVIWIIGFVIAFALYYVVDNYIINLS